MATIREWRNEEWETGSKARDQHELQFMTKKILAGADINETTWSDKELKLIAEAERKLALLEAEANAE